MLSSPTPPSAPDATEPVSAGAVIDPVALGKLRELDPTGRSGIVMRVLRTYEGSLQKLMVQFAEARAVRDPAGLRHVAHTLRSSSASIGALALSARCADLENLVREGRLDALDPAVEALAAEARQVGTAVRAILADQGSAA